MRDIIWGYTINLEDYIIHMRRFKKITDLINASYKYKKEIVKSINNDVRENKDSWPWWTEDKIVSEIERFEV